MPSKKIALTIAGGTSLGAYEAGVLSELLYALELLKRERNQKFEIDVITGGSAGSLTGSLVARAILHDRKRMAAALYDAWVETVNVDGFLRSPPFNSLITNEVQIQLKHKYFGGARVPYDPPPACPAMGKTGIFSPY